MEWLFSRSDSPVQIDNNEFYREVKGREQKWKKWKISWPKGEKGSSSAKSHHYRELTEEQLMRLCVALDYHFCSRNKKLPFEDYKSYVLYGSSKYKDELVRNRLIVF